MNSNNAQYRLKIAEGFLQECRQDVELKRWRSAVDNAQLAVENAAKTALALVVPVGRTHNPAAPLRQALKDGLFSADIQSHIEQLAQYSETMGFDIHLQTDYGDEIEGITPWEIFDGEDAEEALTLAEESVGLARKLVEAFLLRDD